MASLECFSPIMPRHVYSHVLISLDIFISEEDYEDAISFYTKAIEVNPFVAAYYGNRSFAYLRTECFGYALEDASKALQIDPKYIKVGWGKQVCMREPV